VRFGAILVVLGGCAPDARVRIEAGPDEVPLLRYLTVTTDAPVDVTVHASLRGETRTFGPQTGDALSFPLLGLTAGEPWALEVVVDGVPRETTVLIPDLPDALPHITVNATVPDAMEPGFTLLPLTSATGGEAWLAVIDAFGDLRWLYDLEARGTECRLQDNGRLLLQTGDEVREIDWEGRLYDQWVAETGGAPGVAIPGFSFHHDVRALPGGGIVTLTKHSQAFDAYPDSYADPTSRSAFDVSVDEVIAFTRAGVVTSRLPVSDFLDPDRIAYDGLKVAETGGKDWAHLNAVVPDGDAWVVSLRHQDAVVRVDAASGEIDWIFGNHDNWSTDWQPHLFTAVGAPFRWPYHQHAPSLRDLPEGGRALMVFDNGNYRASPWTSQSTLAETEARSRIVAYQLDEDTHQARQLWEFVPTPQVFSSAMGDADWLPETGHILADFAFVRAVDGVMNAELGRGDAFVRLIEFVPETAEVVWDVELWGDPDDETASWQSYRAHRFADFPR
jgi:hypothetical protein